MTRKYCHFMVKKTAIEFAGAYYEEAAKDAEFFKAHPSQNRFIRAHWGLFLDQAREGLRLMLDSPEVPDGNKVQIRDALVKDGVLMGQFPVGISPLLH